MKRFHLPRVQCLCLHLLCLIIFNNVANCQGFDDLQLEQNREENADLASYDNSPNILSAQLALDKKSQIDLNSPVIEFENDYGSFHVRVKCIGKGVTSLSALQCDSPKECQKLMPCFDRQGSTNSSDCPRTQIIYHGQKCSPNYRKATTDPNMDCFILEDRRWALSSGLIECTTGSEESGNSQRTIEQFFKGTDQYFHLVKSNAHQISLVVKEKQHEPVEYIEYVGKPVLYTNKKIDVHCRATKFLFSDIRVTVTNVDGTKHQIAANSSLPGDEDKYWEKFYWEAYSPSMSVNHDMASFSCQGERNDASEWTSTSFDFTTKDPSEPKIDKSKATRTILWAAHNDEVQEQYVGCNYTGGPASVELIRELDGRNIIDRYVTAYGEIRERRGLLQKHVYELQQGNYTCTVSNSRGNDSFQFYVDIPKSQGFRVLQPCFVVALLLVVVTMLQ